MDLFQYFMTSNRALKNAKKFFEKDKEYWISREEMAGNNENESSESDLEALEESDIELADSDLSDTDSEMVEARLQNRKVTSRSNKETDTMWTEHISESNEDEVVDITNEEKIGVMVKLGLMLLRKHYNQCADATAVVMTLDPRYNMAYLRKSSWRDMIAEYVKPCVEKVYEAYKQMPQVTLISSQVLKEVDTTKKRAFCNMRKAKAAVPVFIDSDDDTNVASDNDAEERHEPTTYYQEMRVTPETNPLEWWLRKKQVYPTLSKIYFDHASIPATSISAEQLFSSMGLACRANRSRILGRTLRYTICVKKWFEYFDTK
jgi:hypothetical protein